MQIKNIPKKYLIIGPLFAAGLVFLASFIDMTALSQQLRLIHWWVLPFASVALFIGIIFLTIRWRYLLGNKPALANTFHTGSVSYLLNMVTPIPAPATRIVVMGRVTNISMSQATSSIFVERIIEQTMRFAVLGGAVLFSPLVQVSGIQLVSMLLVIIGGFGLMVWTTKYPQTATNKLNTMLIRIPRVSVERAEDITQKLLAGLSEAGGLRQIGVASLLSLIIWGCFLGFYYLGVLALPVDMPPRQMLVLALAALAIAPPSAPAMFGVYQAVIITPLAVIGLANETTLTTYALIMYTLQLLFWLILGGWALKRLNLNMRMLIKGKA